ncbi:MAG: Holliday junction branch migration protein RuvA [Clostridia bacterium]|nr:Holliday junction branch migration protein RuvA [Clostridia bacterium]MDH7572771.1 Holliday junction branch migration protein RuvA [Clostridia bacterium]
MIAFLRGTLVSAGPAVVLEVGGIGFLVQVPARTAEMLPPPGSPVMLYTWLQVREDGVNLYGFSEAEERDLFVRLVGVNGLGPKGALGLLSVYGGKRLVEIIGRGDTAALTRVPGIGPKLAQRVVLELKDRLTRRCPAAQTVPSGEADEVLNALTVLGYVAAEVEPLVREARRTLGEESAVEELLAYCLKRLDPSRAP